MQDNKNVPYIQNAMTIAFLIVLVIIFSGTVFLTSSKFNNEVNSIKKYFLLISFLLLLFVVIIINGYRKFNTILVNHLFNALFCVGTIECVNVITQYLLLLNNGLYKVIPTGTFENPAGVITHLVLLFPLGLSWLLKINGGKKIIVVSQILLYIFVVCVCESRAGLTAMLISSVILFTNNNSFRKLLSNPFIIIGLIIIFSLLCVIIYRWKLDSSNGRILIWTICLNMIKAKTLLGYGHDGFTANYMLAQADYFFNNPYSQYARLADNTSNPFNLFLHITIILGIIGLLCLVGLLVFLFYRVSRLKNEINIIWYSVMGSLLTMSMFTYPLHYAPVWFIVVLLLLYPIHGLLPSKICLCSRIIIASIIGGCLYCVNHMVLNEIRWKQVQDKSFNEGKTYSMLKYYKRLYPQLRYNKYFLYNYGAELNYCGYYTESKQIMDECINKLNNYDVQLIQADNYYNIGDTISAINSYKIASLMIPCRFIPLKELLAIYIAQDDREKALSIAKKIIYKPIKIPSDVVYKIRNEAKDYYEHNK